MKIAAVKKFAREDFSGSPEWFNTFLDEINNFSDQMITFTENNIIYEDNIYCQPVDYNFTHGQQVKFLNKLKGKPRGLLAVAAQGYAIDAAELQYDNSGQIVITVYFNKPDTYFQLSRSANQTITNNTDTLIQWQVQTGLIGNGLEWSSSANTRITCITPGRYLFDYTLTFEPNNAGSRASWFTKNGVTTGTLSRFAMNYLINNGAYHWIATGSHVFNLNQNDYVELWCFQDRGGTLDVVGNNFLEVNLAVKKLEYSPTNVPCKLYILG